MSHKTCTNGDIVQQEKYYLYNNLWGADTGTGSQCLWATSLDDTHLAWETEWRWLGRDDTIKSYAAVVLGWHGGWRAAQTGLPLQLSGARRIRTSWRFNLEQQAGGKSNVAYDIWFSDNPQQDNEHPTKEVMIWLFRTDGVEPIGVKRTETVIAEVTWELWEGLHPELGWPVYSFVRIANTSATSLDLMEFFRFLYAYGLSDADYLLGIEAGPEIFVGVGRLETTFYTVEIEEEKIRSI